MRSALLFSLLLLAATRLTQAETTPYWVYSYQGIELIAPGDDGTYARRLAHNVHRLDAAARKLLNWDTGAPLPPTHVYVLHHSDFAKLVPPSQVHTSFNVVTTVASKYAFHDGENFALMDAQYGEYSGAYIGLAGSILLSEKLRYPRWFAIGYTRLVAPARLKGSKVIIGDPDKLLVRFLRSQSLHFIPVRTLLNAGADDPVLQRELMDQKYVSECWLLVHLITIEGLHKAEFAQYLQLINSSVAPADAFALSFKTTTYEDLDKAMHDTLEKGMITTLSYDIPDESDSEQPRQLSAAEAGARVTRLAEIAGTDPPEARAGHQDR